jgi:WD40 repeat protein
MKRFWVKGIILVVLVSCLTLAGCKRRMSPEEFAKNLHSKFTLKSHATPVLAIAYSPDGKVMVSTDSDGKIIFWDTETGEQKKMTAFHNIPLYALAYSLDGEYIAMAGRDQGIVYYDGKKLEPISSFIAHNEQILALSWGPKQMLASTSCAQRDPRQWCTKGEVAVWKFGEKGMNPAEVKRFPDHQDWINAVAFSPNGKFLVTGGGDNLINVYETKTWTKVNTLKGHTSRVSVLAFPGKASDLVGSASLDGTARLWEVPDGDQEKLYKADGDKFMAMAFSSDGKMMATGGTDQKILIWLVKKEKILKELSGLEGQVSALAFSPDGTSIAAGLYDNNILIWKAEKIK